MKAILVGDNSRDIFTFADSAVGRDVMPLFVPDFNPDGTQWQCRAALAFRIERLGKNVSPKFALRYIDAVGVVALLTPAAPDGQERSFAQLPTWLGIMDSGITTGKWLALPDEPIVMRVGDSEIAMPDAFEEAARAVVTATSLATVKTGDIIIPALPMAAVPVVTNTRLEASICGEKALSLKIK